jgi:uncharacterized protein YbdZ (MbtH family)
LDTTLFVIVMNGEDQYSIWPADRELPNGWSAAFGPSAREHCLDEIERRWTDLRPTSLREAMGSPPGGRS